MNILVIQGSPDSASFSGTLAKAYADRAREIGHHVEIIDLGAEPDFDPVLRFGYRKHMSDETLPKRWQGQVSRADHLAVFFPIWWTAEPSVLKGWVERVFTPRFAYAYRGNWEVGLLKGRTASIYTTCRGPAFYVRMYGTVITRWKHFILGHCGIRLRNTLVLGGMDTAKDVEERRERFVQKVRKSVPSLR